MSVQVIHDPEFRISVLYCNTSDWAFGPVMYGTTKDDTIEFIQSLPKDPRLMIDADLDDAWHKWQEAHDEL